jgi:glycosyltransferase involved in cell wall biosynthesis
MTVVVNGRFLRATPVGLHRVARSMLDAVIEVGLEVTVLAPPGVDDPRVDRHGWGVAGRYGDHLWEQVALPLAARDAIVLSLANTAPLASPRSVVVVHDLAPVVGPQWFAKNIRAYARLVLAAARRARLVVTVSEAVRRELIGVGVDPGRVDVVHPAVDPSFRPADDDLVADVRARHGLDKPFALLAGWADPRKDVTTALAAHHLARVDVDHDLVLVGRTHPSFARVDVGSADSVRNLGYVSDHEMRALLTAASVLLYPTRYEGFGLPPLEAWACGTPTLVSDLPVLRESLQGNGMFLPPGDVPIWAHALRGAIAGELSVPSLPTWNWHDAGRKLRDVLWGI